MATLTLSAKLDRSDQTTPWGFRMHGGKDFGMPLTIQRVTPGSLASKCGLLVGDTILRIGESPADRLRHKEAQQKIILSSNSLELSLQRGAGGGLRVSQQPAQQQRPSSPGVVRIVATASPRPDRPYSPVTGPGVQRLQMGDRQPGRPYSPIDSVNAPGSPRIQTLGQAIASPLAPFRPSSPFQGGHDYNRAAQPFHGSSSSMPVVVNKQYNTPMNLYSVDNVVDTLSSQTAGMNLGQGDPIPPWRSQVGGAPQGRLSPAQPVRAPSPRMVSASSPRMVSAPSPRAPGGGGGSWAPKVPTGPRKMRSALPGEAKRMDAVSTGTRVPICSTCSVAIRGPFVMALDKSWCPDHFVCSNPQCRCQLIGIGFVEEEGQLFCERDYEQYFAPRCGKCGRAILRECVNAMMDTYHPECFLCHKCSQPIGSGSFHTEEGKNYCEKDWQSMFQTKCYGCQFPIEPGDRWVEALNQNWHSECFNCSTCQVNLEGQGFYAKGGKPYCKKHAMGGARY